MHIFHAILQGLKTKELLIQLRYFFFLFLSPFAHFYLSHVSYGYFSNHQKNGEFSIGSLSYITVLVSSPPLPLHFPLHTKENYISPFLPRSLISAPMLEEWTQFAPPMSLASLASLLLRIKNKILRTRFV